MPVVAGEADSVRELAFSECNGTWECIVGPRYKYARHLSAGPDDPGSELLFDIRDDPDERIDVLSGDPSREELAFAERARDAIRRVHEATPPAQLRWAPLPPGGEAYSYPRG
jgi:hypothetical protein